MKVKLIILIFFLLLYTGVSNIHGQESKTGNELMDSIRRQPSFSIFGDNYLITGARIGETPTKTNSDAKFQIGFKQLLGNFDGFFDTFLFMTYRQVTFWDIYQNSFPFRASNYNPSLTLGKLLVNNNKPTGGIWMAIQHESNGQGGEDSRGWNFISLKYATKLRNNWYGSIEGWAPMGLSSENEDLLDYRSNFELGLTYNPTEKLIFESEFRRSFTSEIRGKIMFTANYRISKHKNQFIYLQYFNGYAESLIDYQRHVNMIRIGIAFKDLSLLVFQ